MAKYLVRANYVGDGVKGLLKDGGTGRRAAISKLAESVGGKLEAMYYAFGDVDVFVILDVPDNVTAAGLSLLVNSTGLTRCSLTVLLTCEELDEAAKKHLTYRAPGA
jgi:uncharacterized protein with GYD domain